MLHAPNALAHAEDRWRMLGHHVRDARRRLRRLLHNLHQHVARVRDGLGRLGQDDDDGVDLDERGAVGVRQRLCRLDAPQPLVRELRGELERLGRTEQRLEAGGEGARRKVDVLDVVKGVVRGGDEADDGRRDRQRAVVDGVQPCW